MTDAEIRKLAEAIGHEVYIANMQTISSLLVIASMVMFVAIFVFDILRFARGRK
jgi:uncharacterized membrane protein